MEINYDVFELIMLQSKYLPDVIKMSVINKKFNNYSNKFLKYNYNKLELYTIKHEKIYNKDESKIIDLNILKNKLNLRVSINPNYKLFERSYKKYGISPFDNKYILEEYKIDNLNLLKNIPYIDLWGCKFLYNLSQLENVRTLVIAHCENFRKLPRFNNLEDLSISFSLDLGCIENLKYSNNLKSFKLEHCFLKDISVLKNNKKLRNLYLYSCFNIENIDTIIDMLVHLKKVSLINCPKIKLSKEKINVTRLY